MAELYGAQPHPLRAAFAGQDPKVVSECFAARALWALGYPDQARDRIAGAISLARQIAQAPSLGSLLHRQGKREEARRIVKGAYDWFAEGLDTPDLKAARAALSGF